MEWVEAMNKKPKGFYGLVLAGGKSERMKTDKALLNYHGKAQYVYCYELLMKFCDQAFLSLKENQMNVYDCEKYKVIFDDSRYDGIGPLGGVVSAMEAYPNNRWIILACDLPNVSEAVIQELIVRGSGALGTAYRSAYDQLPEPLCAVYNRDYYPVLKKSVEEKKYCLRKIMIDHNVELIPLVNQNAMDNINLLDEYEAFIKNI